MVRKIRFTESKILGIFKELDASMTATELGRNRHPSKYDSALA